MPVAANPIPHYDVPGITKLDENDNTLILRIAWDSSNALYKTTWQRYKLYGKGVLNLTNFTNPPWAITSQFTTYQTLLDRTFVNVSIQFSVARNEDSMYISGFPPSKNDWTTPGVMHILSSDVKLPAIISYQTGVGTRIEVSASAIPAGTSIMRFYALCSFENY